jgi:hypothetical protein
MPESPCISLVSEKPTRLLSADQERAFMPLTDVFLLSPDGTFIGE